MASATKSQEQLDFEQSIKSNQYGIDISFTVLATLAVSLRYWARQRSAGSHGWDDCLVFLALCSLFVSMALNAIMIENGLGLPIKDVPLPQMITIGKALFGETITYLILLALVKMAILVMYCRVFPLRSFKVTSWILGTGISIWSLMFIILCIFQCYPVDRAWDPRVKGKCLNLRAGYIGNAIPNILTDAFILTMPMWHVWKLQIRTPQRLALTGIFLLGAFVIVASIYRFTRILAVDPNNLSYTLKQPCIWSHVELSTAVICACLPVMRPLLTAFLHLVGLGPKSTQQSNPAQHAGGREISGLSSKSPKKTPEAELAELSGLDEHPGGWTTPPKAESNDELPLNTIRVQKDYEQKVETSPKLDGWLDRRKKSWYPGS